MRRAAVGIEKVTVCGAVGVLEMNSLPVCAHLCVRVCVNYNRASLHDRAR